MTSFAANCLRVTVRRAGLPVLLALLLFAVAAASQEPIRPLRIGAVHDQTRVFRRSLFLLNFTPLQSFEELKQNQENCILVMLGDTRRLVDVPGGLKEFLSKGGAALIASDEPMQEKSKNALAEATGASITGVPFPRLLAKNECYHELDFCPFMIADNPRFMRHPKTGEDLKVATNMPSTLAKDELWTKQVTPFAFLPNESAWWRPLDGEPLSLLFGVAGEVGNGRVVVLADHSIFIDEMMRPTDNGNVEFAANCTTYLRGDNGQRTKVLFVEEGKINGSFNVPTKRLPAPSLGAIAKTAWDHREQILDTANKRLNHAQTRLNELDRNDAFNKQAWHLLAERWNITPRSLVMPAIILATLALLIYGCYRLGIAGRHRPDVTVPPLPRAMPNRQAGGSLIELRHDSVLEAQNIWEAGRQLARDAFEAGGVAAPIPYREPSVKVKGGWWRRFQMRRRVRRLWRLAFLNRPMFLSPFVVFALADELEELKSALKRGLIQVS
jgi:hypothetical protein